MTASEVPVFIVGMPRSGTSLIEQILASHPQAAGAGELPEVPRFADAMRGVLGAEIGYPQCAAELDAGSIESFAQSYLQRLRETDSNAVRVSDKMPANCWHLGLIAVALPNARVIHCQRDPMDTALSIFFRRFTRGHPYAYALADIAAELRGYESMMAHWREQLPLRMLELSYEDLVDNLESGTRALLDFLDLPFDERCLRFHDTERLVHTASAWQVRQPLYSSAVGRWRHYAEQLEPLRRALAQVAN